MSKAIAEMIKKVFFWLSVWCRKISLSGFKYQGATLDLPTRKIFVNFIYQGIAQREPIEKFLRSHYLFALRSNHLNHLLDQQIEFARKIKTITLKQDHTHPEIFQVEYATTGRSQPMLAQDIFENNTILENLSAEDIRKVSQAAKHLQNEVATSLTLLP